MSHALPYWDDAPQPQSHSHSPKQEYQSYTEEEVQELVEKAFQDGWQEGMEEGYKLGKDKGYKEYKVQEKDTEAKRQANEANSASKDTCNTPTPLKTNHNTSFGSPKVPIAKIDQQAVPGGTECSFSATTASNDPKPLSTAPRGSTTSISPTASIPGVQNIEIDEIDDQAVPGDAKCSISAVTATRDPQTLSEASRHSLSSISFTPSSTNLQNVEIDGLAPHTTPTSSSTIKAAYLDTGNTPNDVSVSYDVYGDHQIGPSSNQSSPEKYHPLDTSISEYSIPEAQSNGTTGLLVDYDAQVFASPLRTSLDAADLNKTPQRFMPHHQLPPLPSMQPLNPRPYKREDTHNTISQSPATPHNNLKPPEKPMTAHQSGQFRTPGRNTLVNSPAVTDSEHSIPTLATPSFIIHAQTVIVNNYPSSTNSESSIGENGTIFSAASTTPPENRARNSVDVHQAPAPPTTPAAPPRDLSSLRSNSHHRPFSSLRRRSHRRQSTSAWGRNWNTNQHPKDWGQALQALGWIPPTSIH
jgi:hypothetical protein